MSVMSEFKSFALRGNVVDMAVGIAVGAAFGKVVSTLVSGVVMAPIGALLGGANFGDLFLPLASPEGGGAFATLAEAQAAGAPYLAYGAFLQAVIDLVVVAAVLFVVVKQMNRLRGPAPAAPAVRDCPQCLSRIPAAARRCAHCASEVAPAT